jgi:hypothetical protein
MQGVGRTVKAAPVRIMTNIPEFIFANCTPRENVENIMESDLGRAWLRRFVVGLFTEQRRHIQTHSR